MKKGRAGAPGDGRARKRTPGSRPQSGGGRGSQLDSELWGTICRNVPILLFACEPRGDFPHTWVAENVERITGYSREELLGDPLAWTKRVHPEDAGRFARLFATVLKSGFAEIEYRLLFADGKYHWLIENMTLLRDEAGQPKQIIGSSLDITGRKQAERALLESERRYRQLADLTPNAILLVDLDLTILWANRQAVVLAGREPWEDLIGRNLKEYIVDEDRPRLEVDAKQLMDQGTLASREYRTIGLEGQPFPVECSASVVLDEAWKPKAYIVVVRDISGRKRAEASLRESETRYRTLFEHNIAGVFKSALDGRFLDCNPAFARILGYESPAEVLKRTAQRLYLTPEDRTTFKEALEKQGSVISLERTLLKKNGEMVEVLLSASLLSDERTGESTIQGTIMDVTERNRAEALLKRERETFFSILQGAPYGVVLVDGDGRFLYTNPEFTSITGYTLEDTPTVRFWFRLAFPDPEYRRSVFHEWQADLEKRGPDRDYTIRCRDTSRKLITFRTTPLEEGRFVVMLSDVTEKREAEEQMRLLNTAVEQSAEAILITDPNGLIEYVNPAFTAITGFSREEAIGRNPRFQKSGRHEAAHYESLWQTLLSGQVWSGHFFNRKKDGTIYEEEATISPVRDASGGIEHFVAVKRDVTQHAKLEAQLQAAQRMEAIGRLAGGIAHDFNNLLMVVMSTAELARRRLPQDEPVQSDLAIIQRTAYRAAELTRALLAYSRRQHLEPVDLDLGALIRDILPLLRRLLPENVTIHYVACPEEALVHADRGQMEQVLLNLCINARDAMPGGGTIAIRVKTTVLDESFLDGRPWGRTGRFLQLEVSDTGCGMDRETLEHIFEPFFTTKETGKGSGLGLSTVYGIVKQHQGLIDVESEEGRGTSFRIYLPVIVSPAPQVQPPRPNGRVLRGTETILVVEDHEDLRQLLTRGLADLGYRTLEACDGESALAILSAPGTEVDLVVSDVVMPGMGGFELLRASRRFAPRLAFLLCSGYHDEAHQRWSLPDNRVAFLAKPFEIATLASKIQELLAAR